MYSLKNDYSIFNKYFSQDKNFNSNNKRVQINSETILDNEDDFKKVFAGDLHNIIIR